MEGRKFSSSRSVVIYVRDFLERYDVDALRYYVAVAGPENQDTDFTWTEFIRRNNDELLANWGNLVNRSVSFAARNIGAIPEPGALTDADRQILQRSQDAFAAVGDALSRSRFKNAVTETMRTLAEANKYLSDQAPWKLRESDPERMRTVCHVALQLVDDGKTLLTPFLPGSSQQVYEMLGGSGSWSGMPRIEEVSEDGGARVPGDHRQLRRRGAVGVHPDPARHAAGAARAAVHQARPRRGRRGAGPAGAGGDRGVVPRARTPCRRRPSRCPRSASTATPTST